MKTKTINHSRGPWAVGIETDDNEAQIISADGQHLATVEQCPIEANAHLIASAPEMLAALKGAQSALRKAMPFIKDPDDTSNIGAQLYCGEWLDEVNEAIAHAEGRELGCI